MYGHLDAEDSQFRSPNIVVVSMSRRVHFYPPEVMALALIFGIATMFGGLNGELFTSGFRTHMATEGYTIHQQQEGLREF